MNHMGKQFCPKGHDTFIVGRTKSKTCNECQNIATLKWYSINKEVVNEKNRKHYWDNYSRIRVNKRNHSWRTQGIKNLYGHNFTTLDYNILFTEQKGSCRICGIHRDKLRKSLSVDHNHKTGNVRALLCLGCNTKIGILEGKLFTKALKYLKRFEKSE